MGKRKDKDTAKKSHTLPSSPTHSFSSSSSSDFEFTISLSPRKASNTLCPADELFYKGQLLPLHLSPRISMVRTLLLASSSTSSSSDTTTTASRDSTGSSSNDSNSSFSSDLILLAAGADCCDSSRPSSVTEEDHEFKRHNTNIKKTKYNFSSRFSRFSSVFRKESSNKTPRHQDSSSYSASTAAPSSVKRMSVTAKEVIRKYLKKVKPLYEKLSQRQQHQQKMKSDGSMKEIIKGQNFMSESDEIISGKRSESISSSNNNATISHSFSGNLRYPRRRRSCVSSCPSSMRSSPSHSGILSRTGAAGNTPPILSRNYGDTSTMEELQSAIQGAIAHCKNSMLQNKSMASHEI